MKAHFQECMKKRGATIVQNESIADMRIVDDARRNLAVGDNFYSYKFVDESMKRNRLEDPRKYAVGLKSAADRPVGSISVAAKRSRKSFTREDDQTLYNWIEPFRQNGGAWKGNKIYEQLERRHPQHTFQSWRSRYLSVVSKCTNMTITEHVDPAATSDTVDVPEPQGRPSKRRRINEPQPAITQDSSTASLQRRPVGRLPRATSIRNSPLRTQPTEQVVTATETVRNVQENGLRDDRPNVHAEGHTEPQPKGSRESTSMLAPIASSDLSARKHAGKLGEMDRRSAESQKSTPLVDRTSHNSRDEPGLNSNIPNFDGPPDPSQVSEINEPSDTASGLRVFSEEEAQNLYRAVPHIHNVEPQNIDQSWETMVQELNQHTVAEWRLFYETTVLPEYMRRHNLKTMEELDEHVAEYLAEEQYETLRKQQIKEEPILVDIPAAADHTVNQSQQVQEEGAITSLSRVSRQSRSLEDENVAIDNNTSADDPEPLPVTKSQTILTAVEVRRNGDLIAQEKNQSQLQQVQPPMTQNSVVSPKKRLFGRTLDASMLSSQPQDLKTVTTSMGANEISFGTASTTSALLSLPSTSVSSSKRPPESGQRPPKSVTISQEESVDRDTADQEQSHTGILEVPRDNAKTLSDAIVDKLPSSSAKSPPVDLLGEEDGEDEPIPSSPGLSDTGSEYMPFDTAPRRSQLWQLDETEPHDEVVDDREAEESDNDSLPATQKSARGTSREVESGSVPQRVGPPVPTRSQLSDDDLADEESEAEQSEAKGSPEFEVPAATNVKAIPRTETQALFEQPVPELDEDTTIFDLPPPEGGWEQFSEVEDEMEDIHASVEAVDHVIPEPRAVSLSSETDEAAVEPEVAVRSRLRIALAEETLVVSDHDSEITTSSSPGDMISPTPKDRTDAQQQRPPVHSVSDGSERTASSSRTASSRAKNDEEEDTEDSLTSSEDQSTIKSWFSDQPGIYNTLSSEIVKRLASTALQATILNLPAATFTIRDMVASFQRSEATRKAQFQVDTRIKREYTDSSTHPKFKPKTRVSDEEARSLIPRDIMGVWTIEDDQDFLSQTVEGLLKVTRKHSDKGVKKRAKFLRVRYGDEAVNVNATPKSRVGSARKQR